MPVKGYGWKDHRQVQRWLHRGRFTIEQVAQKLDNRFTVEEIKQAREEYIVRRRENMPRYPKIPKGCIHRGPQTTVPEDRWNDLERRKQLRAKQNPISLMLGEPPLELSELAKHGGTFEYRSYQRSGSFDPLDGLVFGRERLIDVVL